MCNTLTPAPLRARQSQDYDQQTIPSTRERRSKSFLPVAIIRHNSSPEHVDYFHMLHRVDFGHSII